MPRFGYPNAQDVRDQRFVRVLERKRLADGLEFEHLPWMDPAISEFHDLQARTLAGLLDVMPVMLEDAGYVAGRLSNRLDRFEKRLYKGLEQEVLKRHTVFHSYGSLNDQIFEVGGQAMIGEVTRDLPDTVDSRTLTGDVLTVGFDNQSYVLFPHEYRFDLGAVLIGEVQAYKDQLNATPESVEMLGETVRAFAGGAVTRLLRFCAAGVSELSHVMEELLTEPFSESASTYDRYAEAAAGSQVTESFWGGSFVIDRQEHYVDPEIDTLGNLRVRTAVRSRIYTELVDNNSARFHGNNLQFHSAADGRARYRLQGPGRQDVADILGTDIMTPDGLVRADPCMVAEWDAAKLFASSDRDDWETATGLLREVFDPLEHWGLSPSPIDIVVYHALLRTGAYHESREALLD